MEHFTIKCSILEPKDIGNCSNGGVSKFHGSVWVTTDPTTPTERNGIPVMLLEHRPNLDHWRAFDRMRPDNSTDAMFGGCFVQSRELKKRIGQEVVDLHDRFETWEQYEALSR